MNPFALLAWLGCAILVLVLVAALALLGLVVYTLWAVGKAWKLHQAEQARPFSEEQKVG